VEVKYSIVSEECDASIFRVTELLYLESEVIESEKCFFHTEKLEDVWPHTGTGGGKRG